MQIPEANRQHYEAAGILDPQLAELCQGPLEHPSCAWCNSPSGSLVRIMDSIFGGPFHLVQCRRCGLRFVWPRPKESTMITGFVPKRYKPATMPAQEYYASVIVVLESQVMDPDRSRRPSVLDIGCGNAGFLKVSKSFGWTSVGCDWAPECASLAPDLKIITRPFNHVIPAELGGPFDVASMFDYLEHSYGPFEDLEKVHAFLRSGGRLVIKTFLDDRDHERKMLAPPVHLYHFTEDVLLRMIQDAGFFKPIVMHDGLGDVMVTVIAEKISS